MLTQTLLKLMVQVLVTAVRPLPSSSYWVENLLVDFDCGNLADTMDSICLTYNEYNDTHLHYATRAVRSASGEAPAATVTIPDPRSQSGSPLVYHAQARHLPGVSQLYHEQARQLLGLPVFYHAQARHLPGVSQLHHAQARHLPGVSQLYHEQARHLLGLPVFYHAQAKHPPGISQLYHAQARHLPVVAQLYHAQARHPAAVDTTFVAQVSAEDGKMAVLSRQAANMFVKTHSRRHRRNANTDNLVRFNIQDECCNYRRPKTCVLEEITEYCVEPEDGALLTW